MEGLITNYKNPQKFWYKIRKLKGYSTSKNNHLIVNDNKLIHDKEKEEAHRNIWQNTFKMTDEENDQYNRENEVRVEEDLSNNTNKISPYHTSDLTRK